MPFISGMARFCASSYPLSAVTTRSSPMSFLSVLCPSPTQHHSTTLLRIPSRPFLTLKQHIFRAIIDRSSSQQSINPNPYPFTLSLSCCARLMFADSGRFRYVWGRKDLGVAIGDGRNEAAFTICCDMLT